MGYVGVKVGLAFKRLDYTLIALYVDLTTIKTCRDIFQIVFPRILLEWWVVGLLGIQIHSLKTYRFVSQVIMG